MVERVVEVLLTLVERLAVLAVTVGISSSLAIVPRGPLSPVPVEHLVGGVTETVGAVVGVSIGLLLVLVRVLSWCPGTPSELCWGSSRV